VHPDPDAKNLRELWLPAIEWLYSERVRQLMTDGIFGSVGGKARATAADGAPLSDEAVLEAADFGIFIDLASMFQKEDGARTDTELALFKAACAPAPHPQTARTAGAQRWRRPAMEAPRDGLAFPTPPPQG
jgi:hypothetical protein